MDFALTEEQELLLESVDELMEKKEYFYALFTVAQG